MERSILHCDCNSFFASVELLEHPELALLPVAVCGNPAQRHGIILAKNEAAKRYNIQTAETVYSALRKCPQLQLLAPHHERYTHYSRVINAIYGRFTDRVEPFGIDESWLDITGTWQLFGASPTAVAQEIRRTVKNETGLTISVGVSFNKVFAKLGSDYKKPDAVTVFGADDYRLRVWALPVGALLYVGKSAQGALKQMGIQNIGQLAAADPLEIQRKLGKLGLEISRYARGLDDAPVRRADEAEEVKSVGNGLTFTRNLVGADDVRAGLYSLADEVASRLRRHARYATSVQVIIKDTNLKSISRQKPLPFPSYLAKDIGEAAVQLVCANWDLREPIRMLTVTAQNLTDGTGAQQLSLFGDAQKPDKKRESLERSMDTIRAKYGKHAIAAGRAVKNDLGLDEIGMDEKGAAARQRDE
ncbi:MAG: DNA polymerase IV [Ruthenibacterium sp.]